MKRLFVLVLLSLPTLAWGACPKSIAGNYSFVQDEKRIDPPEQTIYVATVTLASGATSTQTAAVTATFLAGINLTSVDQQAEIRFSNSPLQAGLYRYDGRCRFEFYALDDSNPGKYEINYGVVAGATLYTFRGPNNMDLPLAMLSGTTSWTIQGTSHGINTWVRQ